MKYVLRLLIVSDGPGYWTLEKPVEGFDLPANGTSISMCNGPGSQVLFNVESIIHYPDREIGPMVIARCPKSYDIDDAAVLIHELKSGYPGINVRANDVMKPKWYEIYKLVAEFECSDREAIKEVTRSVMLSTNIETAQRNDLFETQLEVLVGELERDPEHMVSAFRRWGGKVDLDKLQIATEVIQLMVINARRFLTKAGIDTSLWPSKCLSPNKS
jgi:hypothetical protein